jgi:ribosomal protein L21
MEYETMYAVFRSGGKQYRASKGERLRLEKLEADEGASVNFDEVLLVGEGSNIQVGTPLLSGTSVSATVLRQGKTKKVSVVKFRRRQNYLRQHTHRQWFTEVEITDIKSGGKAAPAADKVAKAEAPKKAAAEKPAAEKTAAEKPAESKTATEKPAESKTATEKPAESKTATEKPAATKKPAAKKAAAKKPSTKKAPAKKAAKKKASKKTSD